MDDLIRRGALEMVLLRETAWHDNSDEDVAYAAVQAAPSVDAVEVVHACRVWETRERDEGQAEVCVCSLCGAVQFAGLGRAAFCYGCGACMDAQTDQRPDTGEAKQDG